MQTNASRDLHIWSRCHACDAWPIAGARFECQTCPDGPDNDLCERCYAALDRGGVQHPLRGSFADLAGIGREGPHVFTRRAAPAPVSFARWLEVTSSAATAPSIPDRFLVRPELCAGRETFIGSYAFVVDGPPKMLLTCLHVMSNVLQARRIDATAKNPAYSGREVPAVVTHVNLYDVFAPNWMIARTGTASRMRVLPNARIKEDEPCSQRDIAAFLIDPTAQVTAAHLAKRPPQPGEPIWLAGKPDGGAPGRTVAAVVVEQTERTFIFRYPAGAADIPRLASGAPLVDARGEVVAINVGLGRVEGQYFGHGCHVASIRDHLGLT